MLAVKGARQIASDLTNYSVESLAFIHKLTGDTAKAKKWLDAEARLRAMREIHDSLSEISWEEKQADIDQLLSDAEDEVTSSVESVNSWREILGIMKEDE